MSIKKVTSYIKLFFFSFCIFLGLLCNMSAQRPNDLIIFLDNVDQIPPERRLREEYFKVLLAYNRNLFYSFGDYLRILYGDEVENYGDQVRDDTQIIKQQFYDLATWIANDGSFIIRKNEYTPEQLFHYMILSESLTNAFNELFIY